jgi:hypothetical protein
VTENVGVGVHEGEYDGVVVVEMLVVDVGGDDESD